MQGQFDAQIARQAILNSSEILHLQISKKECTSQAPSQAVAVATRLKAFCPLRLNLCNHSTLNVYADA